MFLCCPVKASLDPKPEKLLSSPANIFKDLPPAAGPAIVRAMQKDLPPAYQLKNHVAGYSMVSPSHGLNVVFTPKGPQINTENGSWALTMSGIGYQGSIEPIKQAKLINDDGRMVYERGKVSEWYVNSRWGVEQGFTLHEAPQGRGGLLAIELSVTGDVHPELNGDTLVLTQASGKRIRYTGLHVFDADSTVLPARLSLAGNRLQILFDDTDAKYPVTVDPWLQAAKLTASDGAALSRFGDSVSINGDTIVVGAPWDDGNGTDSGSAYVFEAAAAFPMTINCSTQPYLMRENMLAGKR